MSAESEKTRSEGERLENALLSFEKAIDDGLQPELQDFLSRYPDLEADLSRNFKDHEIVKELLTPLKTCDPESTLVSNSQPAAHAGYEKLGVIGQGGMGIVYKARDPKLNRLVALKIIHPRLVDENARRRMETEARAIAAMDHPNIVRVYGIGEEDGSPHIAMEFVAGGNLAQRRKEQPWPARNAAALMAELAEAVEYAHRCGIVHRDLKCANILLTEDGVPKIADFGLARPLLPGTARLTRAAVPVGTPAYMSPEQAAGDIKAIGPLTDVFGLGTILYELLTGRPPYHGAAQEQVLDHARQGNVQPPRDINPRTPKALERICLKAMAAEQSQRYPSAAALADDLRRFATRPRRRAIMAGAVAIACLAIAAGLVWRFGFGDGSKVDPPANGGLVPLPLKVRPLQVRHYQTMADQAVAKGLIGKNSFAARHSDAVTLTVELTKPAYFYLIGLNFDGSKQLLWPADETGRPADDIEPPKQQRLHFPLAGNRLYLDDNAPSGLQAYVVAASSRPLPAFAQWPRRTAVTWQVLPAADKVWEADTRGAYEVVRGLGADRGTIRTAPGTPPLAGLCRKLRGDGVEAVEAIAFPVLPKEK